MAYADGYLTRREALRAVALAAGAVSLPFSARAATAASGGPAVRFSVFAAKPIADLGYTPKLGAAPLKLQFQPMARSPRYEYRGPMPLRFVDMASGVVVAEVTFPTDMREALLFFSAKESAGSGASPASAKVPVLRYQVAVLDDSAARHPSGAISILNLSGFTLTGSVGKRAVAIEAGLGPTVPIGLAATTVSLSTAIKGRTYTAYRATVQLKGRQRALLVLLPPFNPGGVEVQSRLLLDEPGR